MAGVHLTRVIYTRGVIDLLNLRATLEHISAEGACFGVKSSEKGKMSRVKEHNLGHISRK